MIDALQSYVDAVSEDFDLARIDRLIRRDASVHFYLAAVQAFGWNSRALLAPGLFPELDPLMTTIGLLCTLHALVRYLDMRRCGAGLLRPW